MNWQIWQKQNREAIIARLQPVVNAPNGTLFFEPSGEHLVAVIKQNSFVRLVMVEQANPVTQLTQSRLYLPDPLYLAAAYSQASALALIWVNDPHQIGIVGFGGGRLPMVLHHYLPQATLTCADIEPMMVNVATRFFGVQPDDRLSVSIEDGRDFLARQKTLFDLLFIDVFRSNSAVPYHLVTLEFYRLCRAKLTQNGVLCVNILTDDPLLAEKIKSIGAVFEHIYISDTGGNAVVFATNAPQLELDHIVKRAQALQADYKFSFMLVERAQKLAYTEPDPSAPILTDHM